MTTIRPGDEVMLADGRHGVVRTICHAGMGSGRVTGYGLHLDDGRRVDVLANAVQFVSRPKPRLVVSRGRVS